MKGEGGGEFKGEGVCMIMWILFILYIEYTRNKKKFPPPKNPTDRSPPIRIAPSGTSKNKILFERSRERFGKTGGTT